VKIFQTCSSGVKKLTAALGLCPPGIRVDRGEAVQIIVLISVPASSIRSYMALLAQVVRLLEPTAHRESLLASNHAAEAWSVLSRLESEIVQAAQP
jgi:mannitol/fructose-specific phosphotransferase system IIA component (Ntr-type)